MEWGRKSSFLSNLIRLLCHSASRHVCNYAKLILPIGTAIKVADNEAVWRKVEKQKNITEQHWLEIDSQTDFCQDPFLLLAALLSHVDPMKFGQMGLTLPEWSYMCIPSAKSVGWKKPYTDNFAILRALPVIGLVWSPEKMPESGCMNVFSQLYDNLHKSHFII